MSAAIRRIVTTILLVFSVSAHAQLPVKVVPPQQKILSSENGRYMFGQISELHADQFMVDTQTGRVWQKVVSTIDKDGQDAEVEVFQPVPYVNPDGGLTNVPR